MVQSESENKANTMFNASGFLSAGPEKGLMGKIMTDVKNLPFANEAAQALSVTQFCRLFHCYWSLITDGVVLNG